MAKMVGYACSIRLPWLNKAVQMLEENLPEAEYKEKMNEYLSFEIDSPTRLRKTREILMNVWYYPSEELDATRVEARALLDKYPEQSAAIQYCMLCLTYPVFADVCKIMGKLFEFQEEVTNPALKQKLYDDWGERGTLEATTRRITLTLKEMDILRNETKTRYILNKLPIQTEAVLNFVITQGMKLDGSSYYSYTELGRYYVLLNLAEANRVLEAQLHRRYFSFLGKRKRTYREKVIESYKTDLYIEDTNTLIEVKTLLSVDEEGVFPSITSTRAEQQLEKLSELLDRGYNVVYIVMSLNPKVKSIVLNNEYGRYCQLFRTCLDKGMEVKGFSIRLKDMKPEIYRRIDFYEK